MGTLGYWNTFVDALMNHLGPLEYANPVAALTKLRQTAGTILEYHDLFEALIDRIPSMTDYFLTHTCCSNGDCVIFFFFLGLCEI